MAQAVAQDWFKVGLNVTVELMDIGVMVKNLTSKEIGDLWLIGYGGGDDEGQGALATLQKDFVLSSYFWDNPEWEELYAALTTEELALDMTKRKETLYKLQEIAMQDPPVVYLGSGVRGYAVGPRVKTWAPRIDQNFVPWEVTLT